MKQIICSFIGTSLSLLIAGAIALEWVEQQKREVEAAVRQSISDVADAPANALRGIYDAVANFERP